MCRVNTRLNAKQQHVKENMITRCLNIPVESLHLIVNIIFPEMEGCYYSMVFLNAKKNPLTSSVSACSSTFLFCRKRQKG